jgi:hypothetical protein
MPRCGMMGTTAWMQEVRLQEVIGRVESGTETENESGDRVEESECRGSQDGVNGG